MRRLSLLLLISLLFPVCIQSAGFAMEGAYEKGLASTEADEIAACADDPVPGTPNGNYGFAGKPVSLLGGAEIYTRTDLSIGSVFPITVVRRYNSKSVYDSPVGFGWSFNYDRRLYKYSDGSVTVRRECGIKGRFTWNGTAYIGTYGDAGTLVRNADNTFTHTDKHGEKDTYDDRGRLRSRIAANGSGLLFYYELDVRSPLWGILPANLNQSSTNIVAYDYRLSRIEEQDASGNLTNRYVLFRYNNSTGRLTEITDSLGRTVSYTHDGIGNLKTVSGPNTNATYEYTDAARNHLMTSIDEGNGAHVNTYDSYGRVAKQVHGNGIITFEFITPFKKTRIVTTIKDGSGAVLNTQTRTVEFDNKGHLFKVTDTYGNTTTYVRDINLSNILQEIKYDVLTGVTTTIAYTRDAKDNILTRTEAQGTSLQKTTTYTYDPVYSLVTTETISSVVNPGLVSVVTNSYDPANSNLLTRTETGYLGDGTPYTYTTTYTYYPNGKLWTVDGPRTDVQDVTTYEYTTEGDLWKVTQPLVGTTTYSDHDGLGNPRIVTDPNSNSTIYIYDTNGRVSTVKAPGDTNPTQYFYVSGSCGSSCSGNGKIDHITMPEGNTITYTYDSLGNLASIKDGLNNSINYTYDSEGNKLTEQIKDSGGSLQKSLSYSYDALNRLKRITNPDSSNTEYTYDFRNNKKSAKDPRNNTTNYTYDELGRLRTVNQPGPIDTLYGYNSNNNLTTVTDANNNATTYIYDDKGRVYQVISPDTGTTTYTYDPAGNLKTKLDAQGVTISYAYDALNRLTLIDFPGDTDTIYAYDTCLNGKGRLCSMTDAAGTTTYEYSPKGQVKKETKVIDSHTYVTQYTYDQNGNMKTMNYPSGKVIAYNYTNDRAVSVLNGAVSLASNINYKPFGGMSSITYGNSLAGTVSYDNQYRITGIIAAGVMNLSYPTYDNNGNIKAINDQLDPTKNKSFTYDALDRLSTASASGIWGSLGWAYDGVGNRQTENATSYTYLPGTNKLSTVGGIAFGFDSNGNTAAEGARQFVYNQNQRLVRVTDSGVTKGEYTYNGNGQRVKKNVNGTVTIFHYSLNGQIIAESNSAGTITAEYVYLNGQSLAKMEGANTYYYHNDHLATPQKMTDSSGAVVWSADYKPFGEATVTISTITNNLRFPGQYFDAETGLNYNYFRDYNPMIGRFLQADPLGIQEGVNHLFSYTANNPINYEDPDGLCPGRLDLTDGNRYTMGRPSRANNYQYQRLTRESRVGRLTSSSGDCNCQNRTLTCNYDIFESWHTRTRSYNRRTRQYGSWGPWDGYDDRLIGRATTQYNCQDDTFTITGVQLAN